MFQWRCRPTFKALILLFACLAPIISVTVHADVKKSPSPPDEYVLMRATTSRGNHVFTVVRWNRLSASTEYEVERYDGLRSIVLKKGSAGQIYLYGIDSADNIVRYDPVNAQWDLMEPRGDNFMLSQGPGEQISVIKRTREIVMLGATPESLGSVDALTNGLGAVTVFRWVEQDPRTLRHRFVVGLEQGNIGFDALVIWAGQGMTMTRETHIKNQFGKNPHTGSVIGRLLDAYLEPKNPADPTAPDFFWTVHAENFNAHGDVRRVKRWDTDTGAELSMDMLLKPASAQYLTKNGKVEFLKRSKGWMVLRDQELKILFDPTSGRSNNSSAVYSAAEFEKAGAKFAHSVSNYVVKQVEMTLIANAQSAPAVVPKTSEAPAVKPVDEEEKKKVEKELAEKKRKEEISVGIREILMLEEKGAYLGLKPLPPVQTPTIRQILDWMGEFKRAGILHGSDRQYSGSFMLIVKTIAVDQDLSKEMLSLGLRAELSGLLELVEGVDASRKFAMEDFLSILGRASARSKDFCNIILGAD